MPRKGEGRENRIEDQNDCCEQSSEDVLPRAKALQGNDDCAESDSKSDQSLVSGKIGRQDIRGYSGSHQEHADAGPLHHLCAGCYALSLL